jgi:hypothetical protein
MLARKAPRICAVIYLHEMVYKPAVVSHLLVTDLAALTMGRPLKRT